MALNFSIFKLKLVNCWADMFGVTSSISLEFRAYGGVKCTVYIGGLGPCLLWMILHAGIHWCPRTVHSSHECAQAQEVGAGSRQYLTTLLLTLRLGAMRFSGPASVKFRHPNHRKLHVCALAAGATSRLSPESRALFRNFFAAGTHFHGLGLLDGWPSCVRMRPFYGVAFGPGVTKAPTKNQNKNNSKHRAKAGSDQTNTNSNTKTTPKKTFQRTKPP